MGLLTGTPSEVNHTRSNQRLYYFAYLFCADTRNSLTEICVGVICSCMPSLSRTLRHHASHFSRLKSLFSSRFTYFTELHSRSVSSKEPKSLNPFKRKTKKEFSELEIGMSASGGFQDGSLERLPQYRVESLGTNRFRTFVGEEDQIHLRQDVTVSRQ